MPDYVPADAQRKIDLNQFARTEIDLARQEMREKLTEEFARHKREFDRKAWLVGGLTIVAILGLAVRYFQYERRVNTYLDKQEQITKTNVTNTLQAATNDVKRQSKDALDTAVKSVRKSVNDRVNEEFKAPAIKATVSEVAASQARSLLNEQIAPEVNNLRKTTAGDLSRFQGFLRAYEKQYKGDYEKLSAQTRTSEALTQTLGKQVDVMNRKNKIASLGDAAINDGDRASLDVLARIADDGHEDRDIRSTAFSEFLRVKAFWLSINRISGVNFQWGKTADGKARRQEDLTPCDLIRELANNSEWAVRAKCAELLSSHREVGVPDALLNAIQHDRNLQVVRDAVQSWNNITGHPSADVFGGDLKVWWQTHREEVQKKLAKPKCSQ